VRRAGHCEYFASAMTVMLRALGIPARYVNGFQTGEYNDVGGDFIVRASDAHSWVEVYFPGYGWLEFDPTPAGAVPQTHWYEAFSKYMDWFSLMWGDWVVNYDFMHQISLAQGVHRTSREWIGGIHDRFVRVHDSIASRMKKWQAGTANAPWKLPLAIFAFAIGIAALSWLAADKRRIERLRALWTLRFARAEKITPRVASLHYAEMLRVLARRGFRKAESATPLEFAATFSHAELAAPVGRMTNLYQAARFGEAQPDSQSAAAILREIKSTLARGLSASGRS
jgi:protein-glutamine gamma-glutamyltransferase